MHFPTVATAAALLPALVSSTLLPNRPVADTSFQAGKSEKVSWIEDGESPALSTIGKVDIHLYTGAQKHQTFLTTLATGVDATEKSTNVKIPQDVGVSGPYYWLRFRYDNDDTKDIFTARFAITGLTGTFNASIAQQLEENTDFTLPSSIAALADQTSSSASAASSTPASSSAADKDDKESSSSSSSSDSEKDGDEDSDSDSAAAAAQQEDDESSASFVSASIMAVALPLAVAIARLI